MLIARQKKRENISEYVIYMFQIEDMMRACKMDIEIVKKNIIDKYQQPDNVIKEITYWYENIIELMKNQGITQRGHLQEVLNTIDDITDLHLRLLRSPLHPDYKTAYRDAAPVIGQSLAITHKEGTSEIEICFEMLYMVLLLKLQHKEISNDTMFAIKKISALLSLLSKKYNQNEKDDLDL